MYKKKIKTLDEMKIVSTSGSTRQECEKNLSEYLDSVHIKPNKFYYLEAYMNKIVVGAMAFATVDRLPNKTKNFRTSTMEEGPYVVVYMTYDELLEFSDENSKQDEIKEYIKDKGYRSNEFPFFEIYENEVILYQKLKKIN